MMTMKQEILYAYCRGCMNCEEQTRVTLEKIKKVYTGILAPKNIHTELIISCENNDIVITYWSMKRDQVLEAERFAYEGEEEFKVFLIGLKVLLDNESLENEINEKELVLTIKEL